MLNTTQRRPKSACNARFVNMDSNGRSLASMCMWDEPRQPLQSTSHEKQSNVSTLLSFCHGSKRSRRRSEDSPDLQNSHERDIETWIPRRSQRRHGHPPRPQSPL